MSSAINSTIPEWLSDKDGAAIYGMGRNKFRELAEAAGAVVRIGSMRRNSKKVIDEYLEKLMSGGVDNDN